MIVMVVYLIVGIVGCVMSVQLMVRIAICLTPYVECCRDTCYSTYKMEKEKMRRRTVIYPIIIYDIPTAEVTSVDSIPYPACIVSTAAVEIV